MAIQKTRAIVLKATPIRETSLIASFLTEEFGKLQALAKGVRRERGPLVSHFEIFALTNIVFYEKTKSDLHFLSESVLLDFFPRLRERLDSLAWASYLLELTDSAVPLQERNPEIFRLLLDCLKTMQEEDPTHVVHIYEAKLLRLAGFLPRLDECLRCGKKEMNGRGSFSLSQGGPLCSECSRAEKHPFLLSKGALKTVEFFSENELARSLNLKIDPHTERELRHLFFQLLARRFEKSFKTIAFLRSIEPALR